jgi:hypothetical protein
MPLWAIADQYRVDRTEGQRILVVVSGGEKVALLAQLNEWFGSYGLPILLLRGYGSQTNLDDVAEMVKEGRA